MMAASHISFINQTNFDAEMVDKTNSTTMKIQAINQTKFVLEVDFASSSLRMVTMEAARKACKIEAAGRTGTIEAVGMTGTIEAAGMVYPGK